jgi:competence protein ComEC
MKRPLAVSAVALIIGILVADKVPSIIPGLCAVLFLCFAALLVYRRLSGRSPFLLLALPLMISGFLLHFFNIQAVNNRFLPWQGRQVVVEGAINDEPVFSDGRIIFTLLVDTITADGEVSPIRKGRIKVSVYSDSPLEELQYGKMVQIRTAIEIPAVQRNIGGFDYRRFLAAKGISGVCSINSSQLRVLEGDRSFFLKSAGYAVRKNILDALYGSMPEQEASVVAGMLIGYTQEMPESMEEAFRRAGLSHIMAVSGANLAFLLLPFIWLLKRIGLNPRWASVVSLPVMLIYVFATGMEASVIRAAIMAGIMLLGMIIWRQTDFFCSISASVLLILLSNTFMLFDIGFILSHSAALSLVVFYKPVFEKLPVKMPKVIRDTLAGTFSAQLGVIPVIAGTFNSFSVVSILANLVVVPVTGILTALAAVLAVFWFVFRPICHVLGWIVSLLTGIVLTATQTVSSVPWAELAVATPSFLLTAGYYLILLIIRYGIPWMERKFQKPCPVAMDSSGHASRNEVDGGDTVKGFKSGGNAKRWGSWLIACMLAVYGSLILLDMIPSGKLEIYFADVGQGDCSIIKTPSGKSIIIDGGGSIYDDHDGSYTGEMIVVPVLYDLKITRIDVMIATHGHADHINGLKSVMDKMGVKRLVIADAEDSEMNELTDYARDKGIPVELADQDDIIYSEDGLVLTAIYPLEDKTQMPTGKTANANELSLVTRLDYAGFSAIFTGDIGFPSENLLLGQKALDCDLIKVPHHGSKYSSSAEFIRQVSPTIAVISVGKNRYGHPSEESMKRYASAGAKLYETISHGGIMVRVDSRKPGQMSVWTVIKE